MSRTWRGTAVLLCWGAISACEPVYEPAVEVPDPSLTASPVVQLVAGSGNFWGGDGIFRTVTFIARKYADGTVDGQWERMNHWYEPLTRSHGRVTCLAVVGNRAWIGGVATGGAWSSPPNNGWVFRVVDNSNGGGDPPDQMSSAYFGQPYGFASSYCNERPEEPQLNDVDAGNVIIR